MKKTLRILRTFSLIPLNLILLIILLIVNGVIYIIRAIVWIIKWTFRLGFNIILYLAAFIIGGFIAFAWTNIAYEIYKMICG